MERFNNNNNLMIHYGINSKTILMEISKLFLLLFLWLNYEDKWLLYFNKYIIDYLDISNKFWLWVLSIATIITGYLKTKEWTKHKLIISSNYIVAAICGIIVFLKYRISGHYIFYSLLKCCTVSLCDLIALFTAVSIVIFIRNRINRKGLEANEGNNNSFLSDTPINNIDYDLLDYKTYVERIAYKIMDVNVSKHSWSMGILGPWGSGKSSFVCMLEETLKSNNDNIIIVKYNPRNACSVNKIQEDFFTSLKISLKSYDSRIDSLLSGYMNSLNILDDNKILHTILTLCNNKDKEDIKGKISDALKLLPHRVVVIIEDLDRLLLEEIIEVFKIIDGNASFANVVYIASYDKEQVNRIIDEKYKTNHSFFSDKFFDYEFMLPIST